MLHILRQTPAHMSQSALWPLLQTNDVILLQEDGVFCGQAAGALASQLRLSTQAIYALQADVNARGFSGQLASDIVCIDYQQFVELTAQHSPIIYW